MIFGAPLRQQPEESDQDFRGRIIDRAPSCAVDVLDLAARVWEVPDEATTAEVQLLGAVVLQNQ